MAALNNSSFRRRSIFSLSFEDFENLFPRYDLVSAFCSVSSSVNSVSQLTFNGVIFSVRMTDVLGVNNDEEDDEDEDGKDSEIRLKKRVCLKLFKTKFYLLPRITV